MMYSLFGFLLIVFSVIVQSIDSYASLPRNVTLFVGGGCFETLREEMASEANRYHKTMSATGWEVRSLFGGLDLVRGRDNSTDVSIPGNRSFTRDHFNSVLEDMVQSLKKGDQFLLTILTHGRFKRGGHLLCLGDGSGLDLSDPIIKKSFKKMSENGVAVGVVDNSCYGGQTVDILSDHACVLSTQTADFPSIVGTGLNHNGATSIALDLLESSSSDQVISLEDLFIATGVGHQVTGVFPMISGLNDYNQIGKSLAWLMMSENMMLSRYRGHECKYQDECRSWFNSLRHTQHDRFLKKWISSLPAWDQEVIREKLEIVDQLNIRIEPLKKKVDLYLKKTSSSLPIDGNDAQVDSISSMADLVVLRKEKTSALDSLSQELNLIRMKNYQTNRFQITNQQIESCRRFKLNKLIR